MVVVVSETTRDKCELYLYARMSHVVYASEEAGWMHAIGSCQSNALPRVFKYIVEDWRVDRSTNKAAYFVVINLVVCRAAADHWAEQSVNY